MSTYEKILKLISRGYSVTTRNEALRSDLPVTKKEEIESLEGNVVIYDPLGGDDWYLMTGVNLSPTVDEAYEYLIGETA